MLEEWLPGNRWASAYRMTDDPEPKGPQPVDWLVGAALMVRRVAAAQAGGFDESFWLYGEELEWCYRIRMHGWDIQYVPSATVVHHEGASTSQDRLSSRLAFDRGRILAQQKIHGPAIARRAMGMARLNYGLHLLREVTKWMAGHRRDLRRERIINYWTLLKSDLNG
ncbi:MAG: glycosyltransferase family 2 protein [Thermomicrobiales bacterium]